MVFYYNFIFDLKLDLLLYSNKYFRSKANLPTLNPRSGADHYKAQALTHLTLLQFAILCITNLKCEFLSETGKR